MQRIDHCSICPSHICGECSKRDALEEELHRVSKMYEKSHREWSNKLQGLQNENDELRKVISEYRNELERTMGSES